MRVASAIEAEQAMAGGADRLGLSDARGPLALADVVAIVAAIAGRTPVSAAPRVLSGDPATAAQALADAGVGALELDADADSVALFSAVRKHHPALGGIVVLSGPYSEPGADAKFEGAKLEGATLHGAKLDGAKLDGAKLGLFAERGFFAALLRPDAPESARLTDAPGVAALSQFVHAAQRRGLAAWIGGALEPPDVPRLLALGPDALAFRAGLSVDGRRLSPLDPERVTMMRAMIPRQTADDRRSKPSRGAAPEGPDKVFVRDFIVEAGIGAYRHEHRAPQRMRFNVEADLAPIPDDVADMRDVFSYDVIIDAIRLATRRHVLLVERVALDVADATLRDQRVMAVRVRIEKLDILDGAVGVEIARTRTTP